ncbi:hypothetical protein [Roseibium sediminis]|uniref:hypothetical protein n=1 Tax=Roseibium sediminis TaxID=1775174 RepID=UPI00123D554C|nr:hypothetical protein [Roseibium sediminis]
MSSYQNTRKTLPNGRSSGSFKKQKIEGPFIALTREILESPAWKMLGASELRVLFRLALEHCNQGARENGNLTVTYEDFVGYGVSRKAISKSLRILEELGFIEISAQGRGANGIHRKPSKYRLTWVNGNLQPTNEWRRIKTKADADAKIRKAKSRAKEAGMPYRR